jgi:hypothetical protein
MLISSHHWEDVVLAADVCIAAAVRTPMGSFQGSLASFSATDLGGLAIKGNTAASACKQQQQHSSIYLLSMHICTQISANHQP